MWLFINHMSYRSCPAVVGIVQPTRPIWRCHGPGNRLLRHRQQGGPRAAGAHEERPDQLREAGGSHSVSHDSCTANWSHLSQSQGFQVKRVIFFYLHRINYLFIYIYFITSSINLWTFQSAVREGYLRQARGCDGEVWRYSSSGHHRRRRTKRHRLPPVQNRTHKYARGKDSYSLSSLTLLLQNWLIDSLLSVSFLSSNYFAWLFFIQFFLYLGSLD